MSHTQTTEQEAKSKMIKAKLALKFGTVEAGTLAYYRALSDAEGTI